MRTRVKSRGLQLRTNSDLICDISNQHVIMVWHFIHTKVQHNRTRRFVMLLTVTVILIFIYKEGVIPHYYSVRYSNL